MTQKTPSLKKRKHFDKEFAANLEALFARSGIESRTDFAEFLGVSYVTYCNWRNGRYAAINDFYSNSIEAYLKLSDLQLQTLVRARKTR